MSSPDPLMFGHNSNRGRARQTPSSRLPARSAPSLSVPDRVSDLGGDLAQPLAHFVETGDPRHDIGYLQVPITADYN
jgi:hypothetical protein